MGDFETIECVIEERNFAARILESDSLGGGGILDRAAPRFGGTGFVPPSDK
jgi:hypothetical protein